MPGLWRQGRAGSQRHPRSCGRRRLLLSRPQRAVSRSAHAIGQGRQRDQGPGNHRLGGREATPWEVRVWGRKFSSRRWEAGCRSSSLPTAARAAWSASGSLGFQIGFRSPRRSPEIRRR